MINTQPKGLSTMEEAKEKIITRSESDRNFLLDLRDSRLTTEHLEKLTPLITEKFTNLEVLLLDKNKLKSVPNNIL